MSTHASLALFPVFLRLGDAGCTADCPTTGGRGQGADIDAALGDLGGVKALYLCRPDPGLDFYVALCTDRVAWRRMIKEKSTSL